MIDVLFWCFAVSCLWAIACAFTYEAGRKSGKLEGELETLRRLRPLPTRMVLDRRLGDPERLETPERPL